jgi:hypothetical protein
MRGETIHITNVSAAPSSGTIALPGVSPISFSIPAGNDAYFTFPRGTSGGPVKISAGQPVIASLRAWYYNSFNESVASLPGDAATHVYFPWYDLATAGMRAGTIHITNPGGVVASGSIQLAGATAIPFSVAAGTDEYYTFPAGTRGGPVTITSTQPVLTRLRVWYYSSFNEVSGRPGSLTSTTQYFPWYDLASTGMRGNTIHITNPGTSAVTGTIDLAGWASLPFSVGAGQDAYFMLPTGTFGGPARISATGAVLTSLRALYYSSLNELAGSF